MNIYYYFILSVVGDVDDLDVGYFFTVHIFALILPPFLYFSLHFHSFLSMFLHIILKWIEKCFPAFY